MQITLTLNGRELSEDVRPDMTLFDFCRAHGAKSVKCACETSNCGLCTVLLDGEPVLSCSVLMARANGREVTTLEGVRDGRCELLAQCLAEEGAEQCGFCAPGLEMAVLALDAAHPGAGDEEVRRYLSGNLCRCSGLRGPDARDPPLPRAPRKTAARCRRARCPRTPPPSRASGTEKSRARLRRRTPAPFWPAPPSTPPTSRPRAPSW